MTKVLRTLTAVELSVAIPLGALCAPLVHAHPDNHHADHHGANRIHAHLGGHRPTPEAPARPRRSASAEAGDLDHHPLHQHDLTGGTPAIEQDADAEQITRLQVFVAVYADAFTPPALPNARFILPTPPESAMRRPPEVVHSHGPPYASSTGPRAPPAFPS